MTVGRLVTKHLPADRFAISPGECCYSEKGKNGGSERLEGWRVRGLQIKKGGRGQVRRGADTEGIESER